jgi:hypothetical protein
MPEDEAASISIPQDQILKVDTETGEMQWL